MENVDLLQFDVLNQPDKSKWHKQFDTVIMNPPFGTKHNKGKWYIPKELFYRYHKVVLSFIQITFSGYHAASV